MTGREKIHAAFSKSGTPEIPVVICYEDIFYRDHWKQLTSCPWWYAREPDIERQLLWRRDVISGIGQDWFMLPMGYSREDRDNIKINVSNENIYITDKRSGKTERLYGPKAGGHSVSVLLPSAGKQKLAETYEEIDKVIKLSPDFNPERINTDGRKSLADCLKDEYGPELCPVYRVASPLWHCHLIWGFEGMMTMIATDKELVKYACERYTAQKNRQILEASKLGAEVIYIEECLTDIISPEDFKTLNTPYMAQIVDTARQMGMKSIYYFTGNPAKKMDLIISAGADALSLEESKKGFKIDIEDIVGAAEGQFTVLGNLDAVGILQDGTEEELNAEIRRQIASGRRNKSKFIMCIGSPVTPQTPVERVQLYCNLAREAGK